jgi:hypothetical protein
MQAFRRGEPVKAGRQQDFGYRRGSPRKLSGLMFAPVGDSFVIVFGEADPR